MPEPSPGLVYVSPPWESAQDAFAQRAELQAVIDALAAQGQVGVSAGLSGSGAHALSDRARQALITRCDRLIVWTPSGGPPTPQQQRDVLLARRHALQVEVPIPDLQSAPKPSKLIP